MTRQSVTRQLTDEQRRVVESDGVDLCVVAGAGTGKTHVLTERIVHRVGTGRTDLARLLAITFTEKAAAQMKDRLAHALAATGRAGAREEVEAAAISTVHAFCARLLRDFAIEAGVDPAFRVLDEVVAERRMREALASLVAELEPAELEALAALPGEDPEGTLIQIWRAARESGLGVAAFIATPPGAPSGRDALAALTRSAEAAVAASQGATESARRGGAAALAACRSVPAGDAVAAAEAVAAVLGCFDLRCAEPVKAALAEVRAAAESALAVLAEEALGPLRERLTRAVLRLESFYEASKGPGVELDFADLERRAVALLESRDDVRATVRARWTEVLVDEFQDTNPVQARLVELLRAPGALFVVGDPKQAIYGFRGADVGVFTQHIERAAADGADGVAPLTHSFRARSEVLGVVDRVFREGFPLREPLRAARTFAPREEPCAELFVVGCDDLEEGREAEAAWIAARVVALIEGGEGRPPLRVAAPTEEDPLATRPADFGDVAILLRAMTHVKLVENALTAHDVPYLVVKGRGFFEAREVVDLANLLACVDNPRDDLVFAAVLRSPACGISDDALFLLCRARSEGVCLADVVERWADTADPRLSARDAALLRGFAGWFHDLRCARSAEPLSVLVDRALECSRLETLALARSNGRQRAANLRKIRAMARAADASGDVDLRAFVGEMRDLRAREVRETEAPVAGGAVGAVSVLTVHAAKGLEFPVVFVPDLGRAEGGSRSAIACHAREGLGIKGAFAGGVLADVAPWSYAEIRGRNDERERAEEDRLLYVALTRAAEHLVLSTALSPRGGTRPWWERVGGALGVVEGFPAEGLVIDCGDGARVLAHARDAASEHARAGTRTLLHSVAIPLSHGRLPALDVDEEATADAERLLAEAARPRREPEGTLFSATVSGLVTFARCPWEFRLRHVIGAPEPASAWRGVSMDQGEARDGGPEPGPAAREEDEWGLPLDVRALGRAAHLALERIVLTFEVEPARAAEDALRIETGGAAPDPAQVAKVAEWLRGFAESEIGCEVRSLPREDVRREQALLVTFGRTVVRGQLDLVYRGRDGWTIVDYKAGALTEPTPEYVLQMQLYALALREALGEMPTRLLLFSLPHAVAVPVPCSESDLSSLRDDLVARFLDRTSRNDLTPPPDRPCSTCAYRAACAHAL